MTLYSEASYFDGDHCQHVADRDEQQRLARKREAARKIAEADAEIRRFSTLSNPLPPSQVPQFTRCMDAIVSRPKLVRRLKEI